VVLGVRSGMVDSQMVSSRWNSRLLLGSISRGYWLLTRVAVAFIADFSQLSGPTLHVFGHASNTIELIDTYSVIVANVRQAKNTNDTKGAKVTLLV
jgi:hypothetical protein